MLLVSFPRDQIFRAEEVALVREAVPHAVVLEIDSDAGHVACCGFDPEATRQMESAITKFLADLD